MNDNKTIFHSLAMIEERIQDKLTVKTLAEGIHLSKYHYQRIFKETVGDSVMGYVTKRRLALAAEELAETDSTILEVALKYGYDSHEGFTRSFKAHMGVTPTEYRKYRLSIHLPQQRKENSMMMYSRNTDGIIRELNSLIVEAGETAVYTRKHIGDMPEAAAFYTQFWDFTARRTERMAERLKSILKDITDIAHCPDGISARLLIIKGIEDTAFEASVTAFQTELTIARAMPKHQEEYDTLCRKYKILAEHARVKAEKIAELFNELSSLIFEDMRQNLRHKLQKAVEAGMAAADCLSSSALPYAYIAEGIREIADGLSAAANEDVTVYMLEDFQVKLETIALAAEADAIREPGHKSLFDGIADFRRQLAETADFFRSLSGCLDEAMEKQGNESLLQRTEEKMFGDLAVQEGILLFYLKGEIQKLGDTHLDTRQKEAFKVICDKINRAVKSASHASDGIDKGEISSLLQEAYDGLSAEADELEMYGGPIRYLAEAIKAPLRYLSGKEV